MEYLLLTEDGQTRQPLPVAHTTPSLHTVQGKQVASQLPERFELSHKDCKCTEILQHSLCHCIYSNHFNVTTHSNHIGEPFAPATMRALAARTLPTVHLSSLILTETLTRPNICVLFFSFLFLCASFLSVKVGVIGNSRNARARARASAQPRCIAGIRLNCRGYSKSFGGSGTVGSGAVFRNATHDPFQIGKQ